MIYEGDPMKKDFLLFDLDGTIIDSQDGILNAVQYTLRQFGIEERKEKLQISKTRGICFSVHIVGQYGSGQSIGSRK